MKGDGCGEALGCSLPVCSPVVLHFVPRAPSCLVAAYNKVGLCYVGAAFQDCYLPAASHASPHVALSWCIPHKHSSHSRIDAPHTATLSAKLASLKWAELSGKATVTETACISACCNVAGPFCSTTAAQPQHDSSTALNPGYWGSSKVFSICPQWLCCKRQLVAHSEDRNPAAASSIVGKYCRQNSLNRPGAPTVAVPM